MARLHDDTFITFQYARNLAQDGILTWHKDLPWVDGYTSLSHVLLIALGLGLGFDVVAWNLFICTAAFAGLLALFAYHLRHLGAFSVAVGMAFILFNADFLYWLAAGLDGVLFAAVFFAAYLAYEAAWSSGRMDMRLVLSLCALCATRPEGIFISGALLGHFWLMHPHRAAQARSTNIATTALIACTVIGLVLWRVWLYGSPLPNTYYAKKSASVLLEIELGAAYVWSWLTSTGALLAPLTIQAALMGKGSYVRALFLIGLCALVMVAGGDPHPGFRFLMPAVPLIAIDIAIMASAAGSALIRGALGVVVAACAMVNANPHIRPPLDLIQRGWERVAERTWPALSLEDDEWSKLKADAARELGALFPQGTRIAANDVGTLAFYVGQPILDTHGLNNRQIAHLPKPEGKPNIWGGENLEYLIGREAEVIYLWFPRFDDWSFKDVAQGGQDCSRQARRVAQLTEFDTSGLSEHYLCVSERSAQFPDKWHNFFVREGREEALLIGPQERSLSKCMAQFRAACGIE